MKWSIFMLLRTLPAWLALPRETRAEIAEATFNTAFSKSSLQMSYFDAEAFSARCTDIAVFETEDLQSYYFAVERLRDSPLFTKPYFEIIDIIPAIKDGFRAFEASVGENQ